ncbi:MULTISPECIES: TonB-dependent receptor [Campylobacter]|uniref:TonB-dependent receptor n=2 Tax=Campylobacteraceae TaxID=72294 RepID=UPI00027A36BD|nr:MULTISPECIES: TonB-dependent receptor [Campylobacter]EJP75303.1 TonB-dependent siderophore receptor [Campylobacter sp. FOBRC14]
MRSKISTAACAVLICLSASAAEQVKLEAVEVNSVGDNISESGIDEGFLNKNIQHGILSGKRTQDVPYQINTITKETMNNQGVTGFEEAVKFFPSASIQMYGGSVAGRPQTRGFQGSVVGNVFWDGFYSVATVAHPMAMFESLQIQNGLAGSLYGEQNPTGIFSYTRKRPVENQQVIWGDYASRANFGLGLDSSMKFEKFGYRAVFYGSDGAKQVKGSNYQRRLASAVFELYPTDALTLQAAASYYEHNTHGFAGLFYIPITRGVAQYKIPNAVNDKTPGLGQPYGGMNLKNKTASLKFMYSPGDIWYFEGGFAWQRFDRDTHRITNAIYDNNGNYRAHHIGGIPNARYELPNGYLKAVTEFETWGLKHDFSAQLNGYRFYTYRFANPVYSPQFGSANINAPKVFPNKGGRNGSDLYKLNYVDMKNISVLDSVAINDKFEVMISLSNAWMKSRARTANRKTAPFITKYDKSGLSWAGSLIYKPLENVSLYLTYADSLQEGGSYTKASGDIVVLNPYRSKQYEIGAKARIGELDVSTALFRIERPLAYADSGDNYAEHGKQINQGLEVMAGGRLIENLSVFGSVTLISPKFKNPKLAAADSKVVPSVSKVNSNLLFDYVVPNTNKLAFSANFHYSSGMYIDDVNSQKTPSYFTTDLSVRYTSKTWLGKQTTLRFNVNNVFDKRYWAGMNPVSMDGTGANSGLNSIQGLSLGESRTFMLSAEVKF